MMFTCARYTKPSLDTDKSAAETQHLPSSLITAGPVFNDSRDCTTVTKRWALFTVNYYRWRSPERRWRNRAFTPAGKSPIKPTACISWQQSPKKTPIERMESCRRCIKLLRFILFAHLFSCKNNLLQQFLCILSYCFGTLHLFADWIIGQINSDRIYQKKKKKKK